MRVTPTPEAAGREDARDAAALRQLVIAQIGGDFHPRTHVALGPWCFAGAEEVYPEWETLPFVDSLTDPAERRSQAEALRKLAAALRDELYPELNARHGTHYDRAFWHIVLLGWLLHLTNISWRLWRHVELFIISSGHERFDVPLPTAPHIRPADTLNFVTGCFTGGDLRTWLIGETVRRLAPAHWHVRNDGVLAPAGKGNHPAAPQHKPIGHINGVRWWKRLLLTAVARARRTAPARFGPLSVADSTTLPKSYRDFVTALARATLPESLHQNFARLDAAAAGQAYRRGRIHAVTVNPQDDQQNLVLAHAVTAGERIVSVQHGGVYGTAALVVYAPDLEYCHDTFVTWGWSQHADYAGRFLPLPSPMLSEFAKRRKPGGTDLVFVGTTILTFNPRMDYCGESLEYRRWKRRFIAGLDSTVIRDLRYRPYPTVSYCFDDGAWLRRSFPSLPIVEGDLHTTLQSCRLVVLDYPGTTLAEVLAANIPTICFWNKQQWLLASGAQPLFDQLEAAGILFGRPEDAAAQLNAVVADVEAWWQAPDRQRARARWCQEFARADRLWLFTWLKAFATL